MSDLLIDPEVIEQALAALGQGTLTVGGLDGLLAAVIVCPEPIEVVEWLPMIWVNDDGDEPVVTEPTSEVHEAIVNISLRHNVIAAELARADGAFRPFYDLDGRFDDVLWEAWAEGFEIGMSLRPEAWEAVYKAGGEAADALSLLIALINLAAGDVDPEIDVEHAKELVEIAPDILPECVEVLAAALGRRPLRRPKVGRNIPCSCGSGKKYKKCCGIN